MSKKRSDAFRSFLIYGKEQESRKKVFRNRAKKSTFMRRYDRRNTFLDTEKSNSKRLF